MAALLTCTLIGGALVGAVDLWVIFRKPRCAPLTLPCTLNPKSIKCVPMPLRLTF